MNNQNTKNLELFGSNRKRIYQIGGTAAILTVIVAFSEIAITFLPGGSAPVKTVIDWFTLFQNNWFMALRNLGLLNIVMFALGIPMYFALYIAHRKTNKAFAALAMIISFIGTTVFFATNRAFSMLELSRTYSHALIESQKSILLAAGQAMLSVGKSHSLGTFIGFLLGELAGILMSLVILRGKIFGKPTAIIGITGFTLLLIFEVSTTLIPLLNGLAMIFAMGGGILNVTWLILLGKSFFQLMHKEPEQNRIITAGSTLPIAQQQVPGSASLRANWLPSVANFGYSRDFI